MKFEEKLMKLRKEKALSQEDLAEKLDVTRQTISKWELGQSKPDFEKLVEISKLFNVSMEKLTDDNSDLKENVTVKEHSEKNNLKIALIIIAIVIGIILLLRLVFAAIFIKKTNSMMGGTMSSVTSDEGNAKNLLFSFFSRLFKLANDELDEYEKQDEEFQNKWNESTNWIETLKEKMEQGHDDYDNEVEKMHEQYEEESQKLDQEYKQKYDDALKRQEEFHQEQIKKQE